MWRGDDDDGGKLTVEDLKDAAKTRNPESRNTFVHDYYLTVRWIINGSKITELGAKWVKDRLQKSDK